jgi:pimeloyl-ACP methyl ester carboxylesterase
MHEDARPHVTPFQVAVPDSDLEQLRQRLRATRWAPDMPGEGWAAGMPGETLRELVDAGGHFPALETPELFVEEVRAFFRPLR